MNDNLRQNMQTGSGLMRYQSAPSSYFASLLNNPVSDSGFGDYEFVDLLYPQDSIPETQKVFSGFINNSETIQENHTNSEMNSQFLQPRTSESCINKTNGYSSVPRTMYQTHNSEAANSYSRMICSIPPTQIKPESGGVVVHAAAPAGNSSLIRQSSSPAGLFTGRTLKNGLENSTQTDYPTNSWEDQVISSDDQRNKSVNRPTALLSHHLSLPKSSAEFLVMEQVMQDSVPCKIRAKRGFATHPRSIAERVRRTKISERIRKLQELVPNMEKQTNTSDMLDLAVDYIKDLQKRVKTLSEDRARCKCSARQMQINV